MSVKSNKLKPSAGVITMLLDLDPGTVNCVVNLNVHNPSSVSDTVRIWITTETTVANGTEPPESDLFDTVKLDSLETQAFACGHLAPDEIIWVESATGNSSIRGAALIETGA